MAPWGQNSRQQKQMITSCQAAAKANGEVKIARTPQELCKIYKIEPNELFINSVGKKAKRA